MDEIFSAPKDKTCAKCQQRPATTWWSGEGGTMALVHGCYEARCEICCIEEQLEHARRLAAAIPAMEAQLADLKVKADARES
jgi:hypothetical protein